MGGADSLRTMRADRGMLRTGHVAADFTFRDMMHAKEFAADLAEKTTFFTHLPAAKTTGVGVRLSDMLIATGTGHGAVQTDTRMTQLAFQHMDIADNSMTFGALFPTV